MKAVLMKNGLLPAGSCSSGSQVLALTDELRSGIVIGGFRYGDMNCRQLRNVLSSDFELIVIASPARWSGESMQGIHCFSTPFKAAELVDFVRRLEAVQEEKRKNRRFQPVRRSESEQRILDTAKSLLIRTHGMTEPEAHKYLQKCSMDSGVGLLEAAQMVLRLFG